MYALKEAVPEGEEFNTNRYYLGMYLTLDVKQKPFCCLTSGNGTVNSVCALEDRGQIKTFVWSVITSREKGSALRF